MAEWESARRKSSLNQALMDIFIRDGNKRARDLAIFAKEGSLGSGAMHLEARTLAGWVLLSTTTKCL